MLIEQAVHTGAGERAADGRRDGAGMAQVGTTVEMGQSVLRELEKLGRLEGLRRRWVLDYTARSVAPVAQLDRAPDYESGGWKFESFRARQFRIKLGLTIKP